MTATWEDPPEYSESGSGGGGLQVRFPKVTPITKILLWSNGIIFVLLSLFERWPIGRLLHDVFALNSVAWLEWFPFFPVWQLVTYGFLHGGAGHLLYNLLFLYFFGTMLEDIIGSRRFLTWYLIAVAVSGAAELVVSMSRMLLDPTHLALPVVGASGAILFVMIACATMRPTARVIFIIVPMTLKTLAMIRVGLDLYGLLFASVGTAYLAHLGGALLGFLAVRRRWIWSDPQQVWEARREVSREQNAREDSARLDQLLQRIHDEGIGSLSRREKEFLKRMSARK